jgi:hypothetical protein
MRGVVACVALAAAIATPGLVVAATSSDEHSEALFNVTGPIATPIGSAPSPAGPINPRLRPAVNAVKAALATKGIRLTIEPLGAEGAEAFGLSPSSDCPIVIVFRTGGSLLHVNSQGCSSEGEVETSDGLHITYAPTSLGRTIDQAVATLAR